MGFKILEDESSEVGFCGVNSPTQHTVVPPLGEYNMDGMHGSESLRGFT